MIDAIHTAYRLDSLTHTALTEETAGWQLRWMLRGRAEIRTGAGTCSLQSGQILILPPKSRVTMRLTDSSDLNYAVTGFEASPDSLPDLPTGVPLTLCARESGLLLDYFYIASQLFGDRPKSPSSAAAVRYARAVLEAFLLRISLGDDKDLLLPEQMKISTHISDQKITAAIKQVLTDHLSGNISLDELAKSIGVSKNTAMRVFRADTGMAITEYFTRRKIEEAIRLICESDFSFRHIAESLGFQSPEYFSRVFKKYTGLSPTEFSKNHTKWQGCLASLCP